jgi:DNA-binding NtrC family response regulator
VAVAPVDWHEKNPKKLFSELPLASRLLLRSAPLHPKRIFRRRKVNLDGQLQQIIEELLSHGISLDLAKKEFEKKYIVGAVKRSSGNLGRAAHSLGIHRNTLRNRVGILSIRIPREQQRVSPEISKKK